MKRRKGDQKCPQLVVVPWWVKVGGPRTCLPFAIEAFMGWSLAIGCLSVSGYYYLRTTRFQPYWQRIISLVKRLFFLPPPLVIDGIERCDKQIEYNHCCWLPLTTFTKAEIAHATPRERYHQLVYLLHYYHDKQLEKKDDDKSGRILLSDHNTTTSSTTRIKDNVGGRDGRRLKLLQSQQTERQRQWRNGEPPKLSNQQLIKLLRQHTILRRLATLAMRPPSTSPTDLTNLSSYNTVTKLPLGEQLMQCWTELLNIPRVSRDDDKTTTRRINYDISLVVPCYGERGDQVRIKLKHALDNCSKPENVQLVLINAGQCTNLSEAVGAKAEGTTGSPSRGWGKTIEVDLTRDDDDATATMNGSGGSHSKHNHHNGNTYCNGHNNSNGWVSASSSSSSSSSAGRGPCLNVGARHATGRILSFCHSDTRLPQQWDEKILQVFAGDDKDKIIANSCAFGFSIDTSVSALRDNDNEHDGGLYYPPGIKGVEWTANRRCQWWKLPYGDQCLSMPAHVFDYLGGFPHQPIMEDYDMIKLLRQRAALLPRKFGGSSSSSSSNAMNIREQLVMIPGEPALCSPRRWQRYGVLYVTYMNSKLVRDYESNIFSPQDIYEIYYGPQQPPQNYNSPWENEVQHIIESMEMGVAKEEERK